MNKMLLWQVVTWLKHVFVRDDEKGASLVEYALLLALIAVVAVAALQFLGHTVSNTLNNVANSINSTTGSS
jgi:pilus assembly protein Flp/PilA